MVRAVTHIHSSNRFSHTNSDSFTFINLKENNMKKLLTLQLIGIYTVCFMACTVIMSKAAHAEAEIKEVCHDKVDKAGKPVMDKKTGQPAQDCKKIKVHKKLEGTEIPEKKK